MVQQVQTDVNITPENTLETIEAIWTSSRKIIIGRQTRERIYWESWATLSFASNTISATSWDYYDNLDGTATLTDVVWDLAYTLWGNWVRIPLQWNYQLTINTAHWSTTWAWVTTTTTRVRVDWVTVYTYDNPVNQDHIDTINMTIGKFSVVSMEQDGTTTKTNSYVWWQTSTVTIQKL